MNIISPSSDVLEDRILPRHVQKSDKFDKVLSMPSLDMDELRQLSWSGIPGQLRAHIWRLLSGYAPPVSNRQKLEDTLHRKREEYQSLVHDYYPKRQDDQYKDTFRQIHIDVPRMCPLIPLFQQIVVQVFSSQNILLFLYVEDRVEQFRGNCSVG